MGSTAYAPTLADGQAPSTVQPDQSPSEAEDAEVEQLLDLFLSNPAAWPGPIEQVPQVQGHHHQQQRQDCGGTQQKAAALQQQQLQQLQQMQVAHHQHPQQHSYSQLPAGLSAPFKQQDQHQQQQGHWRNAIGTFASSQQLLQQQQMALWAQQQQQAHQHHGHQQRNQVHTLLELQTQQHLQHLQQQQQQLHAGALPGAWVPGGSPLMGNSSLLDPAAAAAMTLPPSAANLVAAATAAASASASAAMAASAAAEATVGTAAGGGGGVGSTGVAGPTHSHLGAAMPPAAAAAAAPAGGATAADMAVLRAAAAAAADVAAMVCNDGGFDAHPAAAMYNNPGQQYKAPAAAARGAAAAAGDATVVQQLAASTAAVTAYTGNGGGRKRGRGKQANGAGSSKKSKAAAAAAPAAASIPPPAAAAAAASKPKLEDAAAAAAAVGGTGRVSTRRRAAAASADGSSDGVPAAAAAAAAGPAWQLPWGHAPASRDTSSNSAGGASLSRGAAALQANRHSGGGEGGFGGNDSEVDETGLTTQEKNRSAQRRFRQRQKEKMLSLESEVSRLSAALAAAGREARSLKHINNALERALVLRDEHIAGLQEALRIFSPQGIGRSSSSTPAAAAAAATAAATAAAAAAAAARSAGKHPAAGEDSVGLTKSSEAANTAATAAGLLGGVGGLAAAGVSAEVCSRPSEEADAAAAAAATAAAAAAGGGGVLALPLAAGSNEGLAKVVSEALSPDFKPLTQYRGYTAEVVAGMSPEDVVAEYASLVTAVRDSLGQLEQPDADPEVLKTVETNMQKIGALCERVAFYKPRAIRHLVLTNVETRTRAEPDVGHWRSLVPALFLSDQQASELLVARGRFMSDMASLLQSRARVRELISTSLCLERATHIDVLSASLAALDAHEALAEGVTAEHNLHMAFIIQMFKQVLSPLQVARCMAAAWPYFPDPLAITNVLQETHDAETAAAAAAAAAPAGALV